MRIEPKQCHVFFSKCARLTPGRDTVVCQECSLSLAEKRKFYVAVAASLKKIAIAN